MSAIYLDCNATTPIDPEVMRSFIKHLGAEFANEGSRTHEYGARAKQVVQKARQQVASAVSAQRDEVIFTSGATESNNLAILGLCANLQHNKYHIITSAIEHKAVLEPFRALKGKGFEVTVLPVDNRGFVNPDSVQAALRPNTFMVSIMHVNNETGIQQPLDDIAGVLKDHPAFFHTDAAQGFGKEIEPLQNKRIDLISISGHKIYAPQGIGALIVRKRTYDRPPIHPLIYGGGQERGLRPGTLPVALIVALGTAAEIALRDNAKRQQVCRKIRKQAIDALSSLNPKLTGDQSIVLDHVLNLAFPGLDSEALIVALKDIVAISNGSACTSNSYSPSHVLQAMGMTADEANACIRISWCHLTTEVDWVAIANIIKKIY